MRYPAGHKAETRKAILLHAAAGLREQGVRGIGLAAIMRRAGLTHGGFYQHFGSRDDMVAAAVTHMFEEGAALLDAGEDVPAPDRLSRFLDRYLSASHVARIARGCPVPTLASELPHMAETARASYRDGVAALVARLAALLVECGRSDPETLARSMLSELVGAVALARTQGIAEAAETLAASRRHVRLRLGF